jgi:hypothetical protein
MYPSLYKELSQRQTAITWHGYASTVWRFLRKLDIVLLEDPATPLLGIYPEDVPTGKKDTRSTMFMSPSIITIVM